MIGKENIEQKIFEYFEGDLSIAESKELEVFIKNNPEYQVDFDAWQQSTLPSENLQYKYSDDLLVNEKTSPKGWVKWVSGGAFLLVVAFASAGLLMKFDSVDNRLASAHESSIVESDNRHLTSRKTGKTLHGNSEVVFQNSNQDIRVVESNNSKELDQLTEDRFLNKNYGKPYVESKDVGKSAFVSDIQTPSSAIGSDFRREDTNEKAFNAKERRDSNLLISSFKGTKNQINPQKISSVSKVNARREETFFYSIDIPLKKAKFSYENPNEPSFYLTNRKDPYLNYALAHTLEEQGSFAGNGGEGIRAEHLYRSEWPSVTTDNFTSQILSLDGRVGNHGIGLIVNADRIGHGKLNSTSLSLIYSPKLLIQGISIEPSFKVTGNQKSIAWNQIDQNDVKDPRNGVLYASIPFTPEEVLKSTIMNADFGAGILVNAKKFFVGAQVDHIVSPSYSKEYFDRDITIPAKISAMLGTDILSNKDGQFMFSPSLNFVQFGNYMALWSNAQISYQGFFFAGGLATNEEFMASLGYGNGKVRLVYGLGFTKPSEFSGLVVNNKYYESHQFSLRVHLQPKKR